MIAKHDAKRQINFNRNNSGFMKITRHCENYFNLDKSAFNSFVSFDNSLNFLKVISYFTVVIPLIFAAAYGLKCLYNRIKKKENLSSCDNKVKNIANEALLKKDKSAENSAGSIDVLPNEVLMGIFDYLNIAELKKAMNVNHFLAEIGQEVLDKKTKRNKEYMLEISKINPFYLEYSDEKLKDELSFHVGYYRNIAFNFRDAPEILKEKSKSCSSCCETIWF